MTHRDRRNATEDATYELAAHCGRFCNRARAEAASSNALEREPVEIDPGVADRVALIMGQLSRRP